MHHGARFVEYVSRNFVNISKIVRSDIASRSSLLKSSLYLDKLIRSLSDRRNAKHHAQVYADRFRECDEILLRLISEWEFLYASQFPVFDAWVKLHRKTLNIPDLFVEEEHQIEQLELQVFEFLNRRNDLIRESRGTQTELDSILTIFTPSLEEAFANVDDEPTGTLQNDHRPHESIGTNDELFAVARQKYNYLLKKLIPQMQKLKIECDSVMERVHGLRPQNTNDRWQKCLKNLSEISHSLDVQMKKISSSSTYSNLMVLLASQGSEREGQKRPRKNDEDDKDYDEWF